MICNLVSELGDCNCAEIPVSDGQLIFSQLTYFQENMEGSDSSVLNLRKLAPTPKEETRTTKEFKETEAEQQRVE